MVPSCPLVRTSHGHEPASYGRSFLWRKRHYGQGSGHPTDRGADTTDTLRTRTDTLRTRTLWFYVETDTAPRRTDILRTSYGHVRTSYGHPTDIPLGHPTDRGADTLRTPYGHPTDRGRTPHGQGSGHHGHEGTTPLCKRALPSTRAYFISPYIYSCIQESAREEEWPPVALCAPFNLATKCTFAEATLWM